MMSIKEAFENFSFISYSAFAIYGVIAVYVVALLLCIKKKQDWMRLIPCMIFSFVGLGLGAKLFGILSYAMYYIQIGKPLSWSIVTGSGIVFYGGLIGYLLSLWLLMPRFIRHDREVPSDISAATIPLFHGFARIGCFFGGCCYGLPYSGPLCVIVEHGNEFTSHFPVMLVESAFNFLLFGVLLVLLFRSEKLKGQLTKVYLWTYSIFRFIIEFFRGDDVRGGLGVFSFSQYVSIGIWIFLIIALIVNSRPDKKNQDSSNIPMYS